MEAEAAYVKEVRVGVVCTCRFCLIIVALGDGVEEGLPSTVGVAMSSDAVIELASVAPASASVAKSVPVRVYVEIGVGS